MLVVDCVVLSICPDNINKRSFEPFVRLDLISQRWQSFLFQTPVVVI